MDIVETSLRLGVATKPCANLVKSDFQGCRLLDFKVRMTGKPSQPLTLYTCATQSSMSRSNVSRATAQVTANLTFVCV